MGGRWCNFLTRYLHICTSISLHSYVCLSCLSTFTHVYIFGIFIELLVSLNITIMLIQNTHSLTNHSRRRILLALRRNFNSFTTQGGAALELQRATLAKSAPTRSLSMPPGMPGLAGGPEGTSGSPGHRPSPKRAQPSKPATIDLGLRLEPVGGTLPAGMLNTTYFIYISNKCTRIFTGLRSTRIQYTGYRTY